MILMCGDQSNIILICPYVDIRREYTDIGDPSMTLRYRDQENLIDMWIVGDHDTCVEVRRTWY